MDERQSVIGFTEAELGFFIALLIVVLWLITAAVPGAADAGMTRVSIDSLRKLDSTARSVAGIARTRDSLRAILRSRPVPSESLRSGIASNCASLGHRQTPSERSWCAAGAGWCSTAAR